MVDAFTLDSFTTYFFGSFACIMLDVTSSKTEYWKQDHPLEFWKSVVLGAFYVYLSCNESDRRSNQTIPDDVHMSATQGIHSLTDGVNGAGF
jgi:hypothetical protein